MDISTPETELTPTQEELRQVAWDLGNAYPITYTHNFVALTMISPGFGFIHWQLKQKSVESLHQKYQDRFNESNLIIRIYDVTDIEFDGLNAHSFFDVNINGLNGSYYIHIQNLGRNYLAEVGFRLIDGHFHSLARSNIKSFDLCHPSGNYEINGLYVNSDPQQHINVDSIFDSKLFEELNTVLHSTPKKQFNIAIIVPDKNSENTESIDDFIQNCYPKLKTFHLDLHLFKLTDKKSLIEQLHKKNIDIIHAQNLQCAISISGLNLNIPMILSLYDQDIRSIKKPSVSIKKTLESTQIIIVTTDQLRQNLIDNHTIPTEKITIIPELMTEKQESPIINAGQIKESFHLPADAPLVLFSGEISHSAGADLLMSALPHVCSNHGTAHFIFVGEGPLKGELEHRSWQLGIGQRCRFFGDVNKETFDQLIIACDAVVIPARSWQGEGLARIAIDHGKPILTTHQANIHCVQHGENGLITYDNANSIIWGLNELLANPHQGNMLRLLSKSHDPSIPSIETIAVKHYIQYAKSLRGESYE